MDFKCCLLLSSLLRLPSLAMREFHDDIIAHVQIVREYEKYEISGSSEI